MNGHQLSRGVSDLAERLAAFPLRIPGAAIEWFVEHLPSLTIALLALWMPPLLFAVVIDADVIQVPASGFPRLTDPSLLMAAAQLGLMIAALPGLFGRRRSGITLALCAVLAGFMQAMWTVIVYARLSGFSQTILSTSNVESLVGLIVATYVLSAIRPAYH